MTRPRPHSWPVAEPKSDLGLDEALCSPVVAAKCHVSGQMAPGAMVGTLRLSGLE